MASRTRSSSRRPCPTITFTPERNEKNFLAKIYKSIFSCFENNYFNLNQSHFTFLLGRIYFLMKVFSHPLYMMSDWDERRTQTLYLQCWRKHIPRIYNELYPVIQTDDIVNRKRKKKIMLLLLFKFSRTFWDIQEPLFF